MTPEEYLKDQCEKHGFRISNKHADVVLIIATFKNGIFVPFKKGEFTKSIGREGITQQACAVVLSGLLDEETRISRIDGAVATLLAKLCTAC